MTQDDDMFQLPEDRVQPESGRHLRLDSIRKRRTLDSSEPLPKSKNPALRAVEEIQPPSTPEEAPVILESDKKRSAHGGKSVEYTVDEILKTKTTTEETTEKEWGATSKTIPVGWIFTMSTLMLTLIAAIVYLISKNQINESKIAQNQKIEVIEQESTSDVAVDLVHSIEKTVRQYLAATSIEEKILYVRHAEAVRPRMEKYYATRPLKPIECKIVTNMKPLTLEGRAFWQAVAITGEKRGQTILLEQLSSTNVKVDWECDVYYQPMPWEQYTVEQPIQPMAFRLSLKESPRYFGEFSNIARWVSYEISEASSDTILYGYVLRDSPTHQSIQQAIRFGHQRMIVRLQASKTIQLPNAVIIESFVSADIYRLEPPKTLID